MGLFRRKEDAPVAAAEGTGSPAGAAAPEWVTDAERVRPLLRVRLMPSAGLPDGRAPVSKPLLGGDLAAVLEVQDTMAVTPDHLPWWGTEPEELWTVALHNARVRQPSVEARDGVHVMTGDAYTAGNLLRIREFAAPPQDGALVWIPRPEVLMFTCLTDGPSFVSGLHSLLGMRRLDTARGGPDAAAGTPLYKDMIWCRGKTMQWVGASVQEGPKAPHFTFTGSSAFVEVFHRFMNQAVDASQVRRP
ncbi:hypothetical protein [Streptomyces sp. ISID311]|uniref:hypothetical protein n=1 Tax=Streptomyces sp. ISID311 TaxID=2601673 RepID=UPI0011BD3223|nr:hypothetical protein [Streptomyces sp. ISID311]TXC97441.1 hypothetical protein FS847_13090 [Streptomyces sp. ISID311]